MAELAAPKLSGSVGGKGAQNAPDDVRVVQELLNKAILNGEFPGLAMQLPLDGKVSVLMLQILHAYQKANGLLPNKSVTPDKVVIEPGKKTLQLLAKNRLVDARWGEYDATIRQEVERYNQLFAAAAGFTALDWRWAKAMLWAEASGGPDSPEWRERPLLRCDPNDPTMQALQRGDQGASLFVPQELREKLNAGTVSGETNVQAGVARLYLRAMQSGTARPGDTWYDWETATLLYHVSNPDYLAPVKANYKVICANWAQ